MFDGPPRSRIIRIRTYEHTLQTKCMRNFQPGFQTGNAISFAAKRWRDIVADMPNFLGQEYGIDIVAYAHDAGDGAAILQQPAM